METDGLTPKTIKTMSRAIYKVSDNSMHEQEIEFFDKNIGRILPLVGTHSFEDGKEYKENVHYKVTSVRNAKEGGDRHIIIAIPLDQSNNELKVGDQDELWKQLISTLSLNLTEESIYFRDIEKAKSQFHITKKVKS